MRPAPALPILPGVFTRPRSVHDTAVREAVRDGWGFDAVGVDYLAAGFGSHHWIATDAQGSRRFVTVDDLAAKEFLGQGAEDAFAGLVTAFAVARELHDLGLDWVVAPQADRAGNVVRRLDEAYSIAVFPYLDGATSPEYASERERMDVADLLSELHLHPPLRQVARVDPLRLPNHSDLDSALKSLDEPWVGGGPYADRASELLRAHALGVRWSLRTYGQLTTEALRDTSSWTLTHGEPHTRNVMRTGDGLRVIDWDTLLLAPPERDLWMLVGSAGDPVAKRYARATGRRVDQELLDLYALWWDLCEVAMYVAVFRSPHEDTEDMRVSWGGLQESIEALDGRQRSTSTAVC